MHELMACCVQVLCYLLPIHYRRWLHLSYTTAPFAGRKRQLCYLFQFCACFERFITLSPLWHCGCLRQCNGRTLCKWVSNRALNPERIGNDRQRKISLPSSATRNRRKEPSVEINS